MLIFYLLVLLMPLEQHHLSGAIVGGATVIKWIGLVCTIYAAVHLAISNTKHHYLKTVQARIFLLFLPLVFFSYGLMGPDFSIHSSAFLTYISMAFLFFIVLSTVDTLERLRWTLLSALAAIGVTSLYVFKEWMRHPSWGRPGSVAGDANYFALNAVLILPLGVLLILHSKRVSERMFALGCVVITLVSTTLGASRGGLLAFVATFIWVIWHSRRRTRNFIVIAVLFVPPLLLLPSSPVRRFLHPQYGDLAGKRDRLIAWKAGLRMIERHPLIGVGVGEFKPKMREYADPGVAFSSIAHNTYLEVAAEGGLPVFLIFVALLLFTYRGLGHVRKESLRLGSPLISIASFGLQAGFVGYLVGAFFLSAEYEKMFWLTIFLSMSFASLAAQSFPESSTNDQYRVLGDKAAKTHSMASIYGRPTGTTEQPVSEATHNSGQ